MATSDYNRNAFCYTFGLFCLLLLWQRGNATQFTVGGAMGWSVPDNSTSYNYNQWAEKTRFQIGDSLLFVYKAGNDSVVEVNKQDYDNCSTTAPLSPPLSDGHSVFTFNRSGPHYFTSGNKENCLKNEKLVVIVLSQRSNRSSNGNPTAPASAPNPAASASASAPNPTASASASAPNPAASASASAPNPTASASTSPPPSGDTDTLPSPSPAPEGDETPPAGTVEISPVPPPESSEPHSGASSSMFFSFIGFTGAVFASCLLF